MEELNFTGNCLKGSRPILSFDASFEKEPHTRLLKELFTHIFGVPKGARKSKPFIDHVMGFTLLDGKIWIRCYQINETEETSRAVNGEAAPSKSKKVNSHNNDTDISLIEIGPRFVLTPIIIQESSFGGPIIYENKRFVSPNQVRRDIRMAKAGRYNSRSDHALERKIKKDELGLRSNGSKPPVRNELDDDVLFS
jgi:ribosome biogenesis protein BRX1